MFCIETVDDAIAQLEVWVKSDQGHAHRLSHEAYTALWRERGRETALWRERGRKTDNAHSIHAIHALVQYCNYRADERHFNHMSGCDQSSHDIEGICIIEAYSERCATWQRILIDHEYHYELLIWNHRVLQALKLDDCFAALWATNAILDLKHLRETFYHG